MDIDGAGHHDAAAAIDRFRSTASARRGDDMRALDPQIAGPVEAVDGVDEVASLEVDHAPAPLALKRGVDGPDDLGAAGQRRRPRRRHEAQRPGLELVEDARMVDPRPPHRNRHLRHLVGGKAAAGQNDGRHRREPVRRILERPDPQRRIGFSRADHAADIVAPGIMAGSRPRSSGCAAAPRTASRRPQAPPRHWPVPAPPRSRSGCPH